MNYEKYINYKIDIPEFHGYLTNILHEVGIPASLKGYMYLKRAIEIAFLCLDTVVGGITKIIYPSVAEYYNTTPSRVERAMRHAIETAWLRGNVDIIENIFSYSYSSEKGKPTNGEFIANIADHLAVKFRDEQRKIIEKIENTNNVNKQIDKYYEWIISSQEKSLLLYIIEAIMAFSSKRINAYDVAQMCGVGHDEAAFVLNGLYPIIVCEGDRYFAFHNDVRLFLQNAIIHNSIELNRIENYGNIDMISLLIY